MRLHEACTEVDRKNGLGCLNYSKPVVFHKAKKASYLKKKKSEKKKVINGLVVFDKTLDSDN